MAADRGLARVYDVATGRPVTGILGGHLAGLAKVSFSPDSLSLITYCNDLTAKVWNIATGRELLSEETIDAIRRTQVRRCGFSGLMLPVLEDPVLAARASDRTYGVQELLLFSSVCGTGLDVVPLAGDTPVERIVRLVHDVAALAVKWQKPLSARLLPVPGVPAGGRVHFDDPLLTECVAMQLE